MTQAILPIDPSDVLQEELIDVLSNDVCMSLIAAIGVGVGLGYSNASSESLFDITKLRYA